MVRVEGWLELLRRKMALIWAVATDRRLPWHARAPAALALAYVASPIDLIPDGIPGVGWLDDLVVVLIAASVTPLLVPRAVIASHDGAPDPAIEPLAAGGRALVVLFWLLIIVGGLLAAAAIVAAGADLGFGDSAV